MPNHSSFSTSENSFSKKLVLLLAFWLASYFFAIELEDLFNLLHQFEFSGEKVISVALPLLISLYFLLLTQFFSVWLIQPRWFSIGGMLISGLILSMVMSSFTPYSLLLGTLYSLSGIWFLYRLHRDQESRIRPAPSTGILFQSTIIKTLLIIILAMSYFAVLTPFNSFLKTTFPEIISQKSMVVAEQMMQSELGTDLPPNIQAEALHSFQTQIKQKTLPAIQSFLLPYQEIFLFSVIFSIWGMLYFIFPYPLLGLVILGSTIIRFLLLKLEFIHREIVMLEGERETL